MLEENLLMLVALSFAPCLTWQVGDVGGWR